MKIKIVIFILIASTGAIRADPTIESAQQALKEQGFYYGEVTGEKNSDTTAAIRRYQIRHGLQITGELNEETLRSLRSEAGTSQQPSATRAPVQNEDTSQSREESPRENANLSPAPLQPFLAPPQDRLPMQPAPGAVVPLEAGLFSGTPYEHAPPDVQRNVIVSAQMALTRQGLFRKEIDGAYGPDLEFSLRAYQSRVGLPITGRLDLETLAALELLPGPNAPIYAPRRRIWREPPVRGEWIRP